MSRKDTIIIALLVNAGLLALLFMLAINTEDDKINDSPEISKVLTESSPSQIAQNTSVPITFEKSEVSQEPDEVDNFLRQLSSDELNQAVFIDEDGYVELEKSGQAVAIAPKIEDATKEDTKVVAKEATKEAGKPDSQKYVDVTVKRGDILEKIARSNGTTVDAIKKLNSLNSNSTLQIGQVLKVPLGKKTDAKVTTSTKTSEKTSEKKLSAKAAKATSAVAAADAPTTFAMYHTIKAGDSPWKIAKQYGVSVDELLKLNGLTEEKAKNLKIGDKLRVK